MPIQFESELRAIEPNLGQFSALLEIIQDTKIDADVRARAISVIGLLISDCGQAILEAAESQEVALRRSAAAVADQLPGDSAAVLLSKLLADPDAIVRHTAANHLPIPSRGAPMTAIGNQGESPQPSIASPCDKGANEDELVPEVLPVKASDELKFHYWICRTSANVLVRLVGRKEPLFEGFITGQRIVPIRGLRARREPYLLHWSFQRAGLRWQTRAELLVNGVCRFRHFKYSEGKDPVNRGFLVLKVSGARKKSSHKQNRKK